MATFKYNDMEFAVTAAGQAWDITRTLPNGSAAMVGAGLFAGMGPADALARALALVKAIYPVGIKVVGPDVAHPNMIGDLRIVGPDVTHPNFIYWDQDSASFPA
jgi:Zn-dependent alcohol dehydrogenase